jgi:hypothetical protein
MLGGEKQLRRGIQQQEKQWQTSNHIVAQYIFFFK